MTTLNGSAQMQTPPSRPRTPMGRSVEVDRGHNPGVVRREEREARGRHVTDDVSRDRRDAVSPEYEVDPLVVRDRSRQVVVAARQPYTFAHARPNVGKAA